MIEEQPLPIAEDFAMDQIVGWSLFLLSFALAWVGFGVAMVVQGQLVGAKQHGGLAWILVALFFAFAAALGYAGWLMREGERKAFVITLCLAVVWLAGGIPGVVLGLSIATYSLLRLKAVVGPEPWTLE